MTQKEIAAISGISQQYLSSLERGKLNPTVIASIRFRWRSTWIRWSFYGA
ncbi:MULTISPECIES: helix-turn-helix transcriptional regulator [Stappiaceae]|nr:MULTISPECIES: helix-turn-helix transcriptional regulator [Stappiaceae]